MRLSGGQDGDAQLWQAPCEPAAVRSCGSCQKDCAHSAITITDRKASIDHSKCVGCGRCIGRCPVDAVEAASDEANDILNCKIAEYTWLW